MKSFIFASLLFIMFSASTQAAVQPTQDPYLLGVADGVTMTKTTRISMGGMDYSVILVLGGDGNNTSAVLVNIQYNRDEGSNDTFVVAQGIESMVSAKRSGNSILITAGKITSHETAAQTYTKYLVTLDDSKSRLSVKTVR